MSGLCKFLALPKTQPTLCFKPKCPLLVASRLIAVELAPLHQEHPALFSLVPLVFFELSALLGASPLIFFLPQLLSFLLRVF